MAIFFSECADGLKYSLGGDTLVFDEAQAFCQDIGGSLAVPGSIDRLNRLVNFLIDNGGDSAIVGLRDFGSIRDPSSFIGVDGQVYGFTAVGNFNDFPWGGDIDENCLEISAESGLLEAVSCFSPRNFVCEHFCSTAPSFVFDSCQSDVQLYLNHEFKTYDEALVDCQSVDPTATLAIPESQEKLNQINNFLAGTAFSNSFVYVGVGDFTQNQNLLSFDRFFGADGSASDFIQSDKAWAVNQPDNLGGDQFCAGVNSLLFDDSCQVLKPSLCQRSCSVEVDKEFVFDSCTNNNQFFYNPEALSFDDAAESCESLGGRLAIPSSSSKTSAIREFNRRFTSAGSHVGLRDFKDVDGFVGARFFGIDTKPNPATARFENFPWKFDEPSNSNRNENCAEVEFFGLNDIPCSELRTSVCERFCDEQPDFVFGECVEEVQYFFNPNLNSFDGARADCHALDAGAELAIPRDEETFRRIQDFYESNRTTGVDAFIGLADFTRAGGSFVTTRFRTPDGEPLSFTSGTSNIFPWTLNEPDDGPGDEDCVSMSSTDSLLQDISCAQQLSSICERPCGVPDPLPTEFPTFGVVEGDCIDDLQYFFVADIGTFTLADILCKSFNSASKLAQPTTLDQFKILVDFYNSNDLIALTAFLGYNDLLFEGGEGNTKRFLTAEGERAPFLEGEPGVFPWQSGQPNDSNGLEQCVRINEASLLVDTACFGFISALCEAPCGDAIVSPPPYEECVDGIQYLITSELTTFEEGLVQCQLVDERAILAEPKDSEEFERLKTFYIANRSIVRSAYLGFSQPTKFSDDIVNSSDFRTADGEAIPFISVPRSIFPWKFAEPNGRPRFDELCVSMGPDGLLVDDRCTFDRLALCQVPCGPEPTASPIPAPELIEGVCSDGIQYLFNPELLSFDTALKNCRAFDESASLAVPRDFAAFDRISKFFQERVSRFDDIGWVGLRKLNPDRDYYYDRSQFTEVDGSENDFTNTFGFPWEFTEPDNAGGEDDCAAIRRRFGELVDANCLDEAFSICERPCERKDVNNDLQLNVAVGISGALCLFISLCIVPVVLCIKCCNCCTSSKKISTEAEAATEELADIKVSA